MSQRGWETAMGMRGYAGSPAEREDRREVCMSKHTRETYTVDLDHVDALGRPCPRIMAGDQVIAFIHTGHPLTKKDWKRHARKIAAALTQEPPI